MTCSTQSSWNVSIGLGGIYLGFLGARILSPYENERHMVLKTAERIAYTLSGISATASFTGLIFGAVFSNPSDPRLVLIGLVAGSLGLSCIVVRIVTCSRKILCCRAKLELNQQRDCGAISPNSPTVEIELT